MIKLFNKLSVERENVGLFKTLYFAFFTSGLMSILLGTVLPYIRDENNLSYAYAGLMLSAHQFGNLIAVLLAGFLPYAIGRKKSTLFLGAGISLGLILIITTKSPWLLLSAFALTGVGRGTMSNICNVTISALSGNKTGALNLLHAIFATGALFAPVIVFIYSLFLSSGWYFSVLTSAALAIIAWALILRSKLSNTPTQKEKGGSFEFLRDITFWVNTMILFFYLAAEASIIGWFVTYFKDTGILSGSAANFTPTMLWLMIMIGRFSCAAISSAVNRNKLLLGLGIGFSLSFGGMLLSKSTITCVIFILAIGISMAGIYPTTLASMRGTSSTMATGFTIAAASVGAILMPGIVGAIADSHGIIGGVASVMAALGIMLLLILLKLIKNI